MIEKFWPNLYGIYSNIQCVLYPEALKNICQFAYTTNFLTLFKYMSLKYLSG